MSRKDYAKKITEDSYFKRIKEVILEVNPNLNPNAITLKAHTIDDLGLDSLETVEYVMGLEEKFDIEIPDEEADLLVTVEKARDYLKERDKKGK